MRWLGYLWTIAVNCFYLFIILAVFDKLHHRPEVVIVAILGLIYVLIRGLGIGLSIYISVSMLQFNKQLQHIRLLLNDPSADAEAEELREAEERENKRWPKLYINMFFLSITSLICLFVLWSELSSY